MGRTNDDFWIKVARYVKGNLSDTEATSLFSEQADDVDGTVDVEQIRILWEQSRNPAQDYHPDVAQGWQRFQFMRDSEAADYRTSSVQPIRRTWWHYVGVAASIILVVGTGYFTWQWWSAVEEVRLVSTDQKSTYYLPDSSQVWLNQGSVLRYSADFNQDNRAVYLEGEAFFDVKRAEGRRFTVYSGLAKTEVIGTSFNVHAYPHDSVTVHVVTGKVAFSPRNEDNAVFLVPGQKAQLAQGDRVAERSVILDPNFRAWQNDRILFDNTSLIRIAEQLEQYYGVAIKLANPNLSNCRYTATFDAASLDEVLNVLVAAGNLSYEKTGSRILLSGTGCP